VDDMGSLLSVREMLESKDQVEHLESVLAADYMNTMDLKVSERTALFNGQDLDKLSKVECIM